MRRSILFFMIALFALSASGKKNTWKYRVTLKDKSETTYSLQEPEAFLSLKAIERRKRQQLPIDSTDLPVCEAYINAIKDFPVKVVAVGKWDNFVTISCRDTACIQDIAALPFVKDTECVWQGEEETAKRRESLSKGNTILQEEYYGAATRQIKLSNGDKLHEQGFKGKGITIAVIDAGFHNADKISLLDNVEVLGTRDFVNPKSDIYAENHHGLCVFSCMAMNREKVMVGTAPEASYWLLRSEDNSSEHLVEQDYWAAAVEFADSVGVDVVNTSLGYYEFDDTSKNYNYCHLDGRYALMSRQASRIASKGMVLVCSAGNAGDDRWKKITSPADADHVLTVGAINEDGELASFSSVGNTADGRIKPDVVALGEQATVVKPDGSVGKANGTSYSSPIMCGMVACLWQACPTLTAKELIVLVRQSADRHICPDNIYGYGIPDVWKAYNTYQMKHNGSTDSL